MELVTGDDVHLSARRDRPSRSARAHVVVVHGFAAHAGEPRVVALAQALAGHGFDVLSYDSRGHGGSEGEATLGDRERLDVDAAVRTAAADGGPVVLVGASMGAIGALRYAAGAPGSVAGVVTVSCPARWRLPLNVRGLASTVLTQTGMGRDLARRRMGVRIAPPAPRPCPPVDLVGGVGAPVALIHGGRDPFLGVANAHTLYAAAAEPRRVQIVEDLGHAFETPAIGPVLEAVDWCVDHRASGAPRDPAERS